MRYHMTRSDGSYNVVDEDGNVVLRDESCVVASNVEFSLNNNLDHLFGECGEVASAIRSSRGPIPDPGIAANRVPGERLIAQFIADNI